MCRKNVQPWGTDDGRDVMLSVEGGLKSHPLLFVIWFCDDFPLGLEKTVRTKVVSVTYYNITFWLK